MDKVFAPFFDVRRASWGRIAEPVKVVPPFNSRPRSCPISDTTDYCSCNPDALRRLQAQCLYSSRSSKASGADGFLVHADLLLFARHLSVVFRFALCCGPLQLAAVSSVHGALSTRPTTLLSARVAPSRRLYNPTLGQAPRTGGCIGPRGRAPLVVVVALFKCRNAEPDMRLNNVCRSAELQKKTFKQRGPSPSR